MGAHCTWVAQKMLWVADVGAAERAGPKSFQGSKSHAKVLLVIAAYLDAGVRDPSVRELSAPNQACTARCCRGRGLA